MTREEYVRAVLASAGEASFQPVQVQKLFFLLDKRMASKLDGPHFDFQPYDYGPFDREVYEALENLCLTGDVEVDRDWRGLRLYRLTGKGQSRGRESLGTLDRAVSGEVTKLVKWVLAQSFTSLVSTIYKFYPDMKANSVFSD